jgi:transcriptional regulator of arginine metabolism
MKRLRQKVILDLVRGGRIASQDELMHGLQSRNIDVSQSTLSRDIQELRLAKAGGFYTLPGAEVPRAGGGETLRRIVKEFVTGFDSAGNLLVVKTGNGNASTVSQALDDAGWPEMVGSIAGENTIFIAVRGTRDAQKLERRIRELLV